MNHCASLLVVIRPFLQQLWGAIHAKNTGPSNTVWTKQIAHTLSWLSAVFLGQSPGLERTFMVSDFLGQGDRLEIGTDASPHGLGGWLAENGVIRKYFYSQISVHDLNIFELEAGSCEGQQVFESLAILVALRAWIPKCRRRIQLTVRSDNVGALTMVLKMRPKSARLAIIAREIALSLFEFSFIPSVVHTPGIAHVLADGLSRIFDPSKPDSRAILSHPAIAQAECTVVPIRSRDFYRTLGAKISSLTQDAEDMELV